MALLSQHLHWCWITFRINAWSLAEGCEKDMHLSCSPSSCASSFPLNQDWQLVQSQPIFTLSIISIGLPLELTLLSHWDIFSLLLSLTLLFLTTFIIPGIVFTFGLNRLSLSASSLSYCLSCLSTSCSSLELSHCLTLLTWSFHAYSPFFTHLIFCWIILFSLLPSTSWILCLFILNRLL